VNECSTRELKIEGESEKKEDRNCFERRRRKMRQNELEWKEQRWNGKRDSPFPGMGVSISNFRFRWLPISQKTPEQQ